MKFKIDTRVFIGKINEIHILISINEKSSLELPGFFQILLDTYTGPKPNRDPVN